IITHRLGETYTAETGFLLAQNPDTVRAPDFAFIQTSRLPTGGPSARWVPVVPDLVIEVASSGDRLTEVRDKIQMWLDAGVRLVWAVFPAQRVIEVWRQGQSERALRAGDTLEGEDVVPGFSVPVREIVG
ncbi:MAG: Uma2 family endonuclease, partial [Ktedonobacterales bacterium]